MPHFLLTFGHARKPVAGIVIIEAPSMDGARMTAVLRRFAPGVPFGEGLKLKIGGVDPAGTDRKDAVWR